MVARFRNCAEAPARMACERTAYSRRTMACCARAELRTVATDPRRRKHGIGHAVCRAVIEEARDLGLRRLFCLTFETRFFTYLGFVPIGELPT